MSAVEAELLALIERSPTLTAAHDRSGWVGMFTTDGRVEDPYGSRPHVGADEIGRFYDTFIAPRQITFHRDADVVVDAAVVRDLTLEIGMASGVTLDVGMHLRYDLKQVGDDWAIRRLRAHWELPAMVAPLLRHGPKAIPPSLRLVRALLRNQGFGGTAGYLEALRRPGRRSRRCVATFLDAAVAGDQVTARRMCGDRATTHGESDPMTVGDFTGRLRGGRWSKLIAAGDTVSASVDAPSGRGVVFCETRSGAAKIARIRYFG